MSLVIAWGFEGVIWEIPSVNIHLWTQGMGADGPRQLLPVQECIHWLQHSRSEKQFNRQFISASKGTRLQKPEASKSYTPSKDLEFFMHISKCPIEKEKRRDWKVQVYKYVKFISVKAWVTATREENPSPLRTVQNITSLSFHSLSLTPHFQCQLLFCPPPSTSDSTN